jgi:hypothetical protein
MPLKALPIILQLRKAASHMWVMNKAELDEKHSDGVSIFNIILKQQ